MSVSPDSLLTPREVARLFRVNPKTVTRWERSGKLPAGVRTLGGHRRYRWGDVAPYLAPEQHAAPDDAS